MIDLSNYSCDKCSREFSRHCKHCYHTAEKPPTRFKPKKKTGVQTPEYSRFSIAPEPKSESKPNPNYVPPASVVPPEPIKFDAGLRVCLIKRGTTEDYKEWNPTLHLNELAVEYNDNEIVGYKIGDGELDGPSCHI